MQPLELVCLMDLGQQIGFILGCVDLLQFATLAVARGTDPVLLSINMSDLTVFYCTDGVGHRSYIVNTNSSRHQEVDAELFTHVCEPKSLTVSNAAGIYLHHSG